MDILLVGNCQSHQAEVILSAIPGNSVTRYTTTQMLNGEIPTTELAKYDIAVSQDVYRKRAPDFWNAFDALPCTRLLPSVGFRGFHPDIWECQFDGASGYCSIIVACSHAAGLSESAMKKLFCREFFDLMGYYSGFKSKRLMLSRLLSIYFENPDYLINKWMDRGSFMNTSNHLKIWVVEDLYREILKDDVAFPEHEISTFIADPVARVASFPTLNASNCTNRLESKDALVFLAGKLFSNEQFVSQMYRQIDALKTPVILPQEMVDRFQSALSEFDLRSHSKPSSNPYRDCDKSAFWDHVVAKPKLQNITPRAKLKPVINNSTKVATAGSCFAQHIARTLSKNNFNYFVTEEGPSELSSEEKSKLTYGLFSARYGNVYSSRQLLQLIRRAFHKFTPEHIAWKGKKGGYIDPFRPNIGETFESVEAVKLDRELHFSAVRKMFTELDVFVFTMGLTECWLDSADGSVFPVAPGVVTTDFVGESIEFRNFNYREVHADMVAFFDELKSINPDCKIILTVSPVPLIATYSSSDALTATTYSKSVLRSVAGDLEEAFDFVQYFPSYEIITGNHSKGIYFENDLRSVKLDGVTHVMRVLMDTLVQGSDEKEAGDSEEEVTISEAEQINYNQLLEVVCDEELILE